MSDIDSGISSLKQPFSSLYAQRGYPRFKRATKGCIDVDREVCAIGGNLLSYVIYCYAALCVTSYGNPFSSLLRI
ncbi:MAG: hypothetical protein SNH28_01510 [Rikenellaceae bacterium]